MFSGFSGERFISNSFGCFLVSLWIIVLVFFCFPSLHHLISKDVYRVCPAVVVSLGVRVAAMMQWKRWQSYTTLGQVQLRAPLAASTSSRGIIYWVQRCSYTLSERYTASDRCQRETGVDNAPKQMLHVNTRASFAHTCEPAITRMQRVQAYPLCIYFSANWHYTNLAKAPFCTNEAH